MKDQVEIFYKESNKIPEKDIERFKILVNKLINVNYLTAFKDSDKSDYYFICNNFDLFYSYFSIGGRELIHFSNQRTIVLQSDYSLKINLNKITSIILLIIRLFYNQKMQDISLINNVVVTIKEIQDKYEQLAISTFERLKIGEISECLRILKKHNIVDFKGSDFQNDDFQIIVYPTIQYAVGINDIKSLMDKINSYGIDDKGEDYEEIEEN